MGSFRARARVEVRGARCIASSVRRRWFDGIEIKKSSGIGRLGRRPRPPRSNQISMTISPRTLDISAEKNLVSLRLANSEACSIRAVRRKSGEDFCTTLNSVLCRTQHVIDLDCIERKDDQAGFDLLQDTSVYQCTDIAVDALYVAFDPPRRRRERPCPCHRPDFQRRPGTAKDV